MQFNPGELDLFAVVLLAYIQSYVDKNATQPKGRRQ